MSVAAGIIPDHDHEEAAPSTMPGAAFLLLLGIVV